MSRPASRERLYFAFAVLGFLVAMSLLGYFVAENGFDVGKMLEDSVDNTVALTILCDLSITALVFFIWASQEGPRLGIQRWWLVIPATAFIGLLFAFPLFLYWRERALHGGGAPAA